MGRPRFFVASKRESPVSGGDTGLSRSECLAITRQQGRLLIKLLL